MKIPLQQAIALINSARDVEVVGCHPTRHFDPHEEGEEFLAITTYDNGFSWQYSFCRADNAEVEVNGDVMTIVTTGDEINESGPVDIHLAQFVQLEPTSTFVAMVADGQCCEASATFVADSHAAMIEKIAAWVRDVRAAALRDTPDADLVDVYFHDHAQTLTWTELPTPPNK